MWLCLASISSRNGTQNIHIKEGSRAMYKQCMMMVMTSSNDAKEMFTKNVIAELWTSARLLKIPTIGCGNCSFRRSGILAITARSSLTRLSKPSFVRTRIITACWLTRFAYTRGTPDVCFWSSSCINIYVQLWGFYQEQLPKLSRVARGSFRDGMARESNESYVGGSK